MLAALVIIPAMATTGATLDQGGPGLLFIYLPNLISSMPGSTIIAIIFFVAVLFAGNDITDQSLRSTDRNRTGKASRRKKDRLRDYRSDWRDRLLIDPGHRI